MKGLILVPFSKVELYSSRGNNWFIIHHSLGSASQKLNSIEEGSNRTIIVGSKVIGPYTVSIVNKKYSSEMEYQGVFVPDLYPIYNIELYRALHKRRFWTTLKVEIYEITMNPDYKYFNFSNIRCI